MFVKKQAEYLPVNIDQTKFFALIFADWKAAQTSTKDIWKLIWMPNLAIRFQLLQGLYATKQTTSGSQMHLPRNHYEYFIITFNIRTNHDLISENVFTYSDSSLTQFKEQFELTY